MKTTEDFENLLRNLRSGNNITDSCQLSSIDRSVYYDWYKDPEKKIIIDKALVECKGRNITLVQRGAAGVKAIRTITRKDGTRVEEEYWLERPDWRAAAWTLERKWPNEYRERKDMDITGSLSLVDMLKKVEESPDESGDNKE